MKGKRTCFQWGVYLVDLGDYDCNVQGGVRPCICVSNDINNTWSEVVQFIPLTSQIKNNLPTHFILSCNIYKFLKNDSTILAEQLTALSTNKVLKFLGRINDKDVNNIKECIRAQFNL